VSGAVLEIDDEALKKLLHAGRVAAEARDYGASLVEAGVRASRVCEAVEARIRDGGAEPAFPCNISINHVAAHYTPSIGTDEVIPEGAVVKVDVGAHVDGYIADTAVTVDLSDKWGPLLEASRSALEAAEKTLRPGVRLYEIGKAIQQAMKRAGFKPVRNLYGHTIGRYLIHAGLSIPNYPERRLLASRLRPPVLFAVEPFATNGRGLVVDGPVTTIYSYTGRRGRMALGELESRLLNVIIERYKTLPFTPRWLRGLASDSELEAAVRSLTLKGALHSYPVLVEAGRGMVAQFEHTYLMLDDRIIVTTRGGEEIYHKS
jgi:methionyl aminopeptidase